MGRVVRIVGPCRRHVFQWTKGPASLAQQHFSIEKEQEGKLARAQVERLEGEAVVEELCRMLGADTSDDGARKHAEELLAAA